MYGYVRRSASTTRYAHFHFAFKIYDDGFVAKLQTLDRYEVKRKKERNREQIRQIEREIKRNKKSSQPHATHTHTQRYFIDADTLRSKRIVL